MRKSDFMAELRAEVCAAANVELSAVSRSTEGCPYLQYWFKYYGGRDGQYIERALQRAAPEAAGATSAKDYIPIVVDRVRQAVAVWVKTGEITGVPEGVPLTVPGAAPAAPVESEASSEAGAVQFKAREGGPRTADLHTVKSRLQAGAPLDSTTRGRMERAFGYDFSGVRVHTDAAAAGLSTALNARAFTIGGDVAFAAGEYQPGTLMGDALIAHELAHVVQQGGAGQDIAPLEIGSNTSGVLENDADLSAAGVVASLWGGATGALRDIAKNAMPRLRSGLSLQRCPCDQPHETIRYRLISHSGFPEASGYCIYCACTKPTTSGPLDRATGPGTNSQCPPGRELEWHCSAIVSDKPLNFEPCTAADQKGQCL